MIYLYAILAYIVLSYVLMAILYTSYVVLMDRIAVHGRDSKKLRVIVGVFLIYDVFCDVFIMSVWGLQLRFPSTVTSRLKSWRAYPDYSKLGYIAKRRFLFATWLCDGYLDRDDVLNYVINDSGEREGDHC